MFAQMTNALDFQSTALVLRAERQRVCQVEVRRLTDGARHAQPLLNMRRTSSAIAAMPAREVRPIVERIPTSA